MHTVLTKTLRDIYIERINATRKERAELLREADRCRRIERLIKTELKSQGVDIILTSDGYIAGGIA